MVELAVALPVKEVYPYNGVVYFMIDSYGMYELGEKKDGDIYKYIPETKEVVLVYPAGNISGSENHKMTVKEEGIYFNYSETLDSEDGLTRVKVTSYYLPFDATEPVKDTEKLGKNGWNDYYFSYQFLTDDKSKQADFVLVNRTKGTEDVLSLGIDAFAYCVAEDTLYATTLGRRITMKLSKKIIVVSSIIFVFCMMIVPMTAIASSSKCPPHYITKPKNQQNFVTTAQHEYIYGTIENEDGTEEYFYEDCTITITIDQYERECTKCELYRAQDGAGEIRHHAK